MKKSTYQILLILSILWITTIQCKEEKNRWDIDVSEETVSMMFHDISKDFYNTQIPMVEFRKKYSFFIMDSIPDSQYEKDRKDSLELEIYKEALKTFNRQKTEKEITELYKHIKHYFPSFPSPTIYFYSSALDANTLKDPIFYSKEANKVFIAIDAFMGINHKFYYGLEKYYRKTMNPENLIAKLSQKLGENIVVFDPSNTQFLNYMVYEGRLLVAQDAFLPKYPDSIKIGFYQKDIDWCYDNQANMWDYLIQNNYLYNSDVQLIARFISPAPFSKFYTSTVDGENVDKDSPGGAGRWIGWQISKKYMDENPKISFEKLMLNSNFEEIFNQSKYQPKD